METGHKLLLKAQKKMYEGRIKHVKDKTQIRIEALERALNSVKTKRVKDRERAEMKIAEMESRLLNNVKTVKHMDEFIQQCEEGKAFKNIAQAKSVVKKLTEMLISAKETIALNDENVNELKAKLKKNTNLGLKIKQNLQQENNMRQFYQKIVMKFCRDIKVYHHDSRKLEAFNLINEYSSDLKYQYNFKVTLKHLNIEKELVNFVNI